MRSLKTKETVIVRLCTFLMAQKNYDSNPISHITDELKVKAFCNVDTHK